MNKASAVGFAAGLAVLAAMVLMFASGGGKGNQAKGNPAAVPAPAVAASGEESTEADATPKRPEQAERPLAEKAREAAARMERKPGSLRMGRTARGGVYSPGQPVELTLELQYSGGDKVTALAIVEKLPKGWLFQEVSSGTRPVIVPSRGATGELTFVWVQVPAFPCTMTYTVVPGPEVTGPQEIEGQAVYRQYGPEMRSETARTVLGLAGS